MKEEQNGSKGAEVTPVEDIGNRLGLLNRLRLGLSPSSLHEMLKMKRLDILTQGSQQYPGG